MSANKKYHKKKPNAVVIDADFRIKIESEIEKFTHSNEMCYEFPSSLSNVERAFVHNLAPKYNLKTKSSGKGKSAIEVSVSFLMFEVFRRKPEAFALQAHGK